MTRFETLFTIRYAIRVLERGRRFWAKIDVLLKVCALLSASSAIYAIGATDQRIAIVFGAFFALTQAIEFALRPADKSAAALAAAAPYANLFAAQSGRADDALEADYLAIAAQDDFLSLESIRRLAYNDVVEERCEDTSEAYVLTRWQRLIAFFA